MSNNVGYKVSNKIGYELNELDVSQEKKKVTQKKR